jgi:hypothetical protein
LKKTRKKTNVSRPGKIEVLRKRVPEGGLETRKDKDGVEECPGGEVSRPGKIDQRGLSGDQSKIINEQNLDLFTPSIDVK